MISAVAILMLCNGIRISLKSKKYNQRNRVCHGVHDTPFLFLHFFHRISRMNRKAFLLIGLLTEFRGTLAAGQWLAPYICSCCFCHADFADDAVFSLWGLFCPTDFTDIHRFFFVGQNFHRISRMNRRHSCLSDFSRNFAELWPLANGLRPIYAAIVFCHADFADDADFSLWGLFRPTDFTDIHRFFMESLLNLFVHSQGVSAPTE